jgi:hypothetical protein
MKFLRFTTRSPLPLAFLVASLAGASTAQTRVPGPLPRSHDVKTPAEVSAAPTSFPSPLRTAPPRSLPAKLPEATSSEPTIRLENTRMFYDEPGDGAVWARGTDYKASFGPEGATYYPRLGPRAPRNVPHSFSPESVTIGGQPLAFAHAATAVRHGDRIELDRGAFVEAYDFTPGAIEQTFVFGALPNQGELVLRIPVASAFEGRSDDAGIEFRGELGRVTYSPAVALDSAGRRASAVTELAGGAITIRVAAEFLQSAVLPLVIDPVIVTYTVDGGAAKALHADVAWHQLYQCSLVAYEEVYSWNDNDIRVRLLNYDGSVRHDSYVEFTTNNWVNPRCANLWYWGQCLVVATRWGSEPSAVVGREVSTFDINMYPQIEISRPQGRVRKLRIVH